MTLQTRYPFLLPKGYVAEDGSLHRRGVMRLATARDEIEPLRDRRVQENDAYLTVLVLARVITEMGDLEIIDETVVEGFFAADLAYLQDLYGIVNFGDPSSLPDVPHIDDLDEHPDELVEDRQRASVEEVMATASA